MVVFRGHLAEAHVNRGKLLSASPFPSEQRYWLRYGLLAYPAVSDDLAERGVVFSHDLLIFLGGPWGGRVALLVSGSAMHVWPDSGGFECQTASHRFMVWKNGTDNHFSLRLVFIVVVPLALIIGSAIVSRRW